MTFKTGDEYEIEFSFTQDQVNQFASLTGDNNPLHLDNEYAASTVFKKPIIHGFLSGSIFSKVLGTVFPGEGSIYMSQSMKFLRPMYVEKNYKAVFKIDEIEPKRMVATISTKVFDTESSKQTIEGEAIVKNPTSLNI